MLKINKQLLNQFILKFNKIRLNHNFKQKKSILTEIENELTKTLIPENLRNKIIYSSIVEDVKFHIGGYKKRKIYENVLKKEMKRKKIEDIDVKPFSATLRTLGMDTNLNGEREMDKVGTVYSKRTPNFPKNWLNDYEYFEGDDSEDYNGSASQTKHGTADPSIAPSKVPCNGCGAYLHCADSSIQGYIPSEIFKGRSETELKTIICQRCHFLKNYNIALDVTVSPEDYVKTVSSIEDKYALAVLIVDLLDFPCSIWPHIQKVLGKKRPIFIVGNKVDLLPKDTKGYLDHIKICLKEEIIKAGLNEMNIQHTALISAKTGFGIEELITKLHKIWAHKGDVYLVGCANVGKSSLFNALLKSDYCKVAASDLVKRATTCPWPGTTLQMLKFPILRPSDIRIYQRFQRLVSQRVQKAAENKLRKDQMKITGRVEHATLMGDIGMTFKNPDEVNDIFSMAKGASPILTLNEKSPEYENSKWCYDTPGVINTEQIHNLLTTEELLLLNPKQMISPRQFKLELKRTLFVAGLGRLDFVDGDLDYIKISVYASHQLPILITETLHSEEVYNNLLGSKLLGIPIGDEKRLERWPKLQSSESINLINNDCAKGAMCDILLSSTGWLGINLPMGKTCEFLVWTPESRGIFIRKPSLIPLGSNLSGQKIRGSLAYRVGKPFIKL